MLKILIVDNQATIIASLSYMLRKIASVVPSESLTHAQNALVKEKFDLVISYLRISDSEEREGLEPSPLHQDNSPGNKSDNHGGLWQ